MQKLCALKCPGAVLTCCWGCDNAEGVPSVVRLKYLLFIPSLRRRNSISISSLWNWLIATFDDTALRVVSPTYEHRRHRGLVSDQAAVIPSLRYQSQHLIYWMPMQQIISSTWSWSVNTRRTCCHLEERGKIDPACTSIFASIPWKDRRAPYAKALQRRWLSNRHNRAHKSSRLLLSIWLLPNIHIWQAEREYTPYTPICTGVNATAADLAACNTQIWKRNPLHRGIYADQLERYVASCVPPFQITLQKTYLPWYRS